jgi:hypothetical protein
MRLSQNQLTSGGTTLLKLGTENLAWSKGAIGFERTGAFDTGSLIFCTNSDINTTDVSSSNERMRIDSSGNLLVGTTSIVDVNGAQIVNAYTLPKTGSEFRSDSSSNHFAITFRNPNGLVGSIATSGSSTSYNTSSDYRLKENVVDMTGAIDRVKALKPSQFNFIADPNTTVDGFLAHEAQAVVPEAVTGTKDAMRDEEYEVTPAVLDEDGNEITPAVMGTRSVPDYQGIDQSKLVPLLTGAVKELIAKVESLEAEVATLKGV